MTKLVESRDRAETRFRKSAFPVDAFRDLASFNRFLEEKHRTAEAFITAHKNDRDAAARHGNRVFGDQPSRANLYANRSVP